MEGAAARDIEGSGHVEAVADPVKVDSCGGASLEPSAAIIKIENAANQLAQMVQVPLAYMVVDSIGSLEVREAPSIIAPVAGIVEGGSLVRGFPAGEWFQVGVLGW